MKIWLSFFLVISFATAKCQVHDLNYYFSHARDNSPLLADYRNQIQAAQVDSQLIQCHTKNSGKRNKQ